MNAAWQWLSDNHGAINAVASVLTLLVWLFYFQLLLGGYRHRLRPMILITRGGGRTVDARCIVTNMSVEAVYVEAVVLTVHDDKRRFVASLSELDTQRTDTSDPRQRYLQGPLGSGEMIDIGSYREILTRATSDRATPTGFTLTAIATYTSEETLVAAEREFGVCGNQLRSDMVVARQIRSPWQRKRLLRLISSEL